MRHYWIYILTSRDNKVMYVGVTGDLMRRLHQHRTEQIGGFTAKYHVHRLVYMEESASADAAIAREKEIKGWRREKKNALVETTNPQWQDLAEPWFAADPSLRSG